MSAYCETSVKRFRKKVPARPPMMVSTPTPSGRPAATSDAKMMTRRRSVSGGMYKKQMASEMPRNYISVDQIDSAITAFIDAGGKEMVGKQEVPGMGWSYIGIDPEGNAIGMFQAVPRRQARRAKRAARRSARSKK